MLEILTLQVHHHTTCYHSGLQEGLSLSRPSPPGVSLAKDTSSDIHTHVIEWTETVVGMHEYASVRRMARADI